MAYVTTKRRKYLNSSARSEVLTEVTLNNQVFWDDTVSTGKVFDVSVTTQSSKASYLPIDAVLTH